MIKHKQIKELLTRIERERLALKESTRLRRIAREAVARKSVLKHPAKEFLLGL